MTSTTTGVEIRIGTETKPLPEAYVSPSELCDTQRRSMAYDAFATLSARGF